MKRKIIILVSTILLFAAFSVTGYTGSKPVLHQSVNEKKQINSDSVGWLQVPGTDIDEVILHRNDKEDYNQYYYRRGFDGNYSFEGSYYADFRCVFDTGKLSRNTVIYGHSFDDDPNGKRFAQLLRYKDKEFAKKNQIIYFANSEKTMVWQVFAVSISTVDVPYNVPNLKTEDRLKAIEEVRKGSIHDCSDIKITDKDRILTLVTSDFSDGKPYPNNYRFVIMARRVNIVDSK